MRFTLHYEGPLPSRGSATVKAAIREALERQLRELWTHPPLSLSDTPDRLKPEVDEADLSVLMTRYGHTFAPLVTEKLGLRAELEILMLRPSPPGEIVGRGGDIDNRLKTLFDALSAPAQKNQVTPEMRPTSPEDPLFVLLEDDGFITRFTVETDRLLAAPPRDPDAVRLYVRVNTYVTRAMFANMGL
jgi:hypothetical protein